MKQAWSLAFVMLLLAVPASRAEQSPHGELLEIHSCQLYIGGCIASSEATQDGRSRLRMWSFSGGSYRGVGLCRLRTALLEVSDDNLATKSARPTEAVAYLPTGATPAQRAALLDWIKTTNPQLANAKLHTRLVAMELAKKRGNVTFSAGDFVRLAAKPFEPCGLTSCGEALWYTPRSTLTAYTVEVVDKLTVHEPLLALRWIDHGKNSVFNGRFDGAQVAAATFSSPTMTCHALSVVNTVHTHTPHE